MCGCQEFCTVIKCKRNSITATIDGYLIFLLPAYSDIKQKKFYLTYVSERYR